MKILWVKKNIYIYYFLVLVLHVCQAKKNSQSKLVNI